jgi:hypothetical protein
MKFLFAIIIAAAVFLPTISVMAQGPAPPPAPSEVPLDGFSALLLAAGAGYGARQVLKRKKDSNN